MVLSEDVLAMTFTSDVSPTLSIDGMLMDSVTIASVLREAIVRSHVKELTLRNVALDAVVAKAAEALFDSETRTWSKLEVIHCTGLISRWIKASIGHVQQFHFTGSVPIAHNPRYSLDFPSLQSLGRALQDFPQLTMLNLRGTRLSMRGLQAFGEGLGKTQTLQTLQMSHCALEEPDHAVILATALRQNRQLTTFCLSHCKFGSFAPHTSLSEREDDFFPTVLEALVGHPTLQSLNIHGMYCNADATQALGNMLRHNPRLWHLGLKNNIRHPEDKLQITNLLGSLRDNTKLTYLQISGNNMDSDDMNQLSDILATSNTTLRALSLTANAIEDDGLLTFAQNLSHFKALRFLDVQRNPITQDSKSEMISALKDNMELERLDMDGTWDATKAFYLGLNRGGRRLLQTTNTCPLSLWPTVLARVNRLPFGRNQAHAHFNVLYCLLTQGPVLFEPRRSSGYKRRKEGDDDDEDNGATSDDDGQDQQDLKEENEDDPRAAKRARTTAPSEG
mmetsp:Transcript_36165/g.56231  ORF Transcript_36165/g.56231 Transcript_36165/m.56231 type:complete len:506 (-) Transcript_36165:154-1671(-)|eukprot:CAMPEP_0117044060 /NCGR_PEP_ID=MMETSP0472-20121206/30567_1 /TAXON_ID=693140 ORGANISM="Tiarina fusus, Strain LIS" /NCGR_SAMPLE_ID=MMETSP0472 /ASSEMBLY_ACC=CAM_ASM_000603 /LENGTH=505 /DNA_ID=CAMNT_0004755705 /DNA_START=403 /DNA_END=1920 /DNA_ORIENTATION=+